jgi:hypothetical protein
MEFPVNIKVIVEKHYRPRVEAFLKGYDIEMVSERKKGKRFTFTVPNNDIYREIVEQFKGQVTCLSVIDANNFDFQAWLRNIECFNQFVCGRRADSMNWATEERCKSCTHTYDGIYECLQKYNEALPKPAISA